MTDIYKRFSENVTFRMRMDKPEGIRNLTWLMGLFGETGEVVDLIKKHIGHSHPLDRDKLVKELGDVEWYMEAIRQAHGFEREEYAATVKIDNTEAGACRDVLRLGTEVGLIVELYTPFLIKNALRIIDRCLAKIYFRYGITREEALEQNIKKLEARYPNGFSTEASLNRKDAKDELVLPA